MSENDVVVVDGFPVDSKAIEVRALSGGFRDAVKVSDVEFHRGVPVFVFLKLVPDRYKLDPTFVLDVKGKATAEQKGWEQVGIMELGGVAFVEEDIAREALAETARRIEVLRVEEEKARGVERLPMDSPGPVVKPKRRGKSEVLAEVRDIGERGRE